jgi:hypothetical protein
VSTYGVFDSPAMRRARGHCATPLLPHGDDYPGMFQVGRVESGNITVTTIASVANSTMAINPKFEAHHRSERTDGLRNASQTMQARHGSPLFMAEELSRSKTPRP